MKYNKGCLLRDLKTNEIILVADTIEDYTCEAYKDMNSLKNNKMCCYFDIWQEDLEDEKRYLPLDKI